MRTLECYWLCDRCASLLSLTFERGRGIVTVRLPANRVCSQGVHLKQLPTSAKGYPRGIERA